MKITIEDSVTVLPVAPRRELGTERVFHTVPLRRCFHKRFIVDDKLAEMTCSDCKEKLNPIWVLQQVCDAEHRYYKLHARYHEELKRLGERSRTKCQHCGQTTKISHCRRLATLHARSPTKTSRPNSAGTLYRETS